MASVEYATLLMIFFLKRSARAIPDGVAAIHTAPVTWNASPIGTVEIAILVSLVAMLVKLLDEYVPVMIASIVKITAAAMTFVPVRGVFRCNHADDETKKTRNATN